MPSTELRRYLELLLVPKATVSDVVARIGPVPARAAVTAALLVALERYFAEEPSAAQAAELVATVRERYLEPGALPPMLGEAVVRGTLGESELLQDISLEEMNRAQILLFYGTVQELRLDDAERDRLLEEAEDAANDLLGRQERLS